MSIKSITFAFLLTDEFPVNSFILAQESLRIINQYKLDEIFKSKIISENKMFEGLQGVYRHNSSALKCEMTFAVFMPSLPQDMQIPVLWFLSGLTCTHENAMLKAGAQKFAQEHNIAVIFPDTSPRGTNIPDDGAYDLGQGAGFYLNATQSPWKKNYKMWDYLVLELPSVIEKNFSVNISKQSVMGHSMGGHGALLMALRLNNQFKSVSALSLIHI